MKYSLNQLKRYVPEISTVPAKELVDRIWGSVAEVESVEYLGEKYKGVVIGRVLEVKQHPKSEKLVVVEVDLGSGKPVIVVTAAHNMVAGDLVPYIPVGGTVPAGTDTEGNPIEIGERNMAGIISYGMLASEREMGVSDDHTGIMIIHPDELRHEISVGEPAAQALELDDVIIEIENKSLTHRGDCLSAIGLAREIAALYNFKLVIPDWQQPSFSIAELFGDSFDKELPCDIDLDIQAKDVVERYSAIVIDGVQVKQSPMWLRVFLAKHGINSVNNIVDITNYIMVDYGQPMHAFDASTVTHKKRNDKIVYQVGVRAAKAGEKIVTLDNKEKKLSPIVAVITDPRKALAIAGIIGGKETGITETSTRVVLEAAVFNKYAIRNASMSIGVVTDASVVFSRKQDPEKTVRALLRCVHLLMELAGAKIVSPIADNYPQQSLEQTIVVSHKKVEEFLGIAVAPTKILTSMSALGFNVVRKNDMYRIVTPSWRPDVTIDEDVYEEIARMVGYKEILPELPTRGIFGVALDKYERTKQVSLQELSAIGMTQTANFSFVSKELYGKCLIELTGARSIVNAISPDVQYVRKQVIPGLLEQLAKNQYYTDRFGLYEFGKVSRKEQSYTGTDVTSKSLPNARFGVDELGLPIEAEHLALGVVDNSDQPGYFTLKQLINKYLDGLKISAIYIHPDDLSAKEKKLLPLWVLELFPLYKKGRMALIKNAETNDLLGIIGEPGTLVQKSFGINKQIAVAELIFYKIVDIASLDPVYKEPSKYPVVTEDYCIEVPADTSYEKVLGVLEKVVKEIEQVAVTKLSVIDIYQKKENTKQITHRLQFSPVTGSLTDKELKEIRTKITQAAKAIKGTII